MKGYTWPLFVVMGFVSACATFQAGSNVQSGRLAFSVGNCQTARSYFESAAQVDPNYVYRSDLPGGSIQSYLGRVDYVTERYAQARGELERALSIDKNDNVARLYLGHTRAHGRPGEWSQRNSKRDARAVRLDHVCPGAFPLFLRSILGHERNHPLCDSG